MRDSIEYYNKNAESFITGTVSVDFTETQNTFLDFLPANASILDFGCGAGRDTKYFLDKGYQVTAIDGSLEMCKAAGAYAGIPVRQMLFHELDEVEQYDGIWACASILHVKKTELPELLRKMYTAAKENGILYISFKYGAYEGERTDRYFTDMTETTLAELLKEIPELRIEKQWVTGDVRPGRSSEKWLNTILRKGGINK